MVICLLNASLACSMLTPAFTPGGTCRLGALYYGLNMLVTVSPPPARRGARPFLPVWLAAMGLPWRMNPRPPFPRISRYRLARSSPGQALLPGVERGQDVLRSVRGAVSVQRRCCCQSAY